MVSFLVLGVKRGEELVKFQYIKNLVYDYLKRLVINFWTSFTKKKEGIMRIKSLVLLFIFLCGKLLAEGCSEGTLVATDYGLVSIENIAVGTSICNEHFVTHCIKNSVDRYVNIFIDDCCISVALDQKFYVQNKGWIHAQALLPSDKLFCFDGAIVDVIAIETIEKQQDMYALCVEMNHIFYISEYGIITHNIELISGAATACLAVVCPPAAAGLAIVEAITAGVICFGAYHAYKKCQKKKKQKKDCLEQNKAVISAGGSGKDPKDEDDDPEKHPYGIYRDASYHTPGGSRMKGPRPKNGQRALDNSVSLGRNSTGRVGISEGEIVVLRRTSERLYHGYVETWDSLKGRGNGNQAIRNALTENRLISRAGKIIEAVVAEKG